MRTSLYEGEKIVYIAKKHWIVYLSAILIMLTGVAFTYYFKEPLALIVGVVVLIWIHIERMRHLWIVTDRRVLLEYGVFALNTKETPLDKLNNISIKKDILGMIFGYGTLLIQSAAEMGLTVARWIAKPELFVQAVAQAQNTNKMVNTENFMECPYCREIIKKEAVKCRFCGSFLKQVEEQKNYKSSLTAQSSEVKKENETDPVFQKNEEFYSNNKNIETENQDFFARKTEIWRPKKSE